MCKVITWGLSEEENRRLVATGAEVLEVFTADGLFHASEFDPDDRIVAVVRLERNETPLVEVLERFAGNHPKASLVVVVPTADAALITRAYEAGARRVTVGSPRSIEELGLSSSYPGSWLAVDATPAQVWVQ